MAWVSRELPRDSRAGGWWPCTLPLAPSLHPSQAMSSSPTGTYLPIRVTVPASGPCQSHSPGICISTGCAQNKMPCSAAPGTPGHGGQDLEENTSFQQRRHACSTWKGSQQPLHSALGLCQTHPIGDAKPGLWNSLPKLAPHSSVQAP